MNRKIRVFLCSPAFHLHLAQVQVSASRIQCVRQSGEGFHVSGIKWGFDGEGAALEEAPFDFAQDAGVDHGDRTGMKSAVLIFKALRARGQLY